MRTKVTLELLKDRLSNQEESLKEQNKWLIDSKKRYEENQRGWNATIKYIEELENDIKVIQKEEAK